jgi:myo-inositol-1(or 4)-monophosphatase
VTGTSRSLHQAAEAAQRAYARAILELDPAARAECVADGADGTPTMRIDAIVEQAVIDALERLPVNLLSEEHGWWDRGHAATLVVDPVDGSANAAAGVPLSCFSAALVVDGEFRDALTVWLHTEDRWFASSGATSMLRTTGRRAVDGAAVSLLRPHSGNREAWWRVAERAERVRVLGCSTLDAALVAAGAIDAFADAGSDTHRLVDLAAAMVLVDAAGGVVVDAYGRAIEFDTDLTRRWSGVVGATPDLAAELAALIRGDLERLDD